jgi:hypothetical protein
MVKVTGYILLTISCLLFGLMLVVPWLNFSKSTIAWITTSLFVAAEILFYLSIFLIGKGFITKIISKLKFWKSKEIIIPNTEQVEQK